MRIIIDKPRGRKSPVPLRQGERVVTAPAPVPATARVLLGAQLFFNVGFYAVVPFIAVVLSDDFGMAGAAVGVVLGVRTFAQQGMFLLGGILADRVGARSVILIGCAVRTTGFLTLSASLWADEPALWLFVAGTVLTGLGGALFSPGLSVLLAAFEARPQSAGSRRATLFAWLSVTGELGAVVGPLAGAALLGWGFGVVSASGAVFFAAVGLILWKLLPRDVEIRGRRGTPLDRAHLRVRDGRMPPSLRNGRFTAFAALHAVDLLAYNQLYFALPLALRSAETAPQTVGLMFAWVSVVTLALQLPVSRWCATVGSARALRAGYATSAAGFLALGIGAVLPLGADGDVVAVLLGATLLTLGHLAANPTALSLVPGFAGAHPTGSYFGLLATAGGVAVLFGNVAIGAVLDDPAGGPWRTVLPWVLLALALLTAAALMPRVLRAEAGSHRRTRTPPAHAVRP